MENDYSNELVGVNNTGLKKSDGEMDKNTIQMMQNFTSTIIGLSQQISENNEAKYKAQAEIMIADIQAKMQEECEEISRYYNTREKQEEDFNTIIMAYQEEFKKLTNELCKEENVSKIEVIKWCIEKLQSGLDQQLDRLANNIASEQSTRLEVSKPRSKGLLGFFKKR